MKASNLDRTLDNLVLSPDDRKKAEKLRNELRDICPKCGNRLLRAPYVIVCVDVLCNYDARVGR